MGNNFSTQQTGIPAHQDGAESISPTSTSSPDDVHSERSSALADCQVLRATAVRASVEQVVHVGRALAVVAEDEDFHFHPPRPRPPESTPPDTLYVKSV